MAELSKFVTSVGSKLLDIFNLEEFDSQSNKKDPRSTLQATSPEGQRRRTFIGAIDPQ